MQENGCSAQGETVRIVSAVVSYHYPLFREIIRERDP